MMMVMMRATEVCGLGFHKLQLQVHQRYRQYHHQMQIVVASLEEIAGLGAARTYTALALQTISKHFRCLKDAIKGQIQVTCKALAEEETLGHTKGETSRLRFIDQQLRQQRAFQQLGMMQQHPWRPQRGLPERSVSVLRAWLFEHFLHPYPKDSDKVLLARQTGLTRNQVSNWFINARVRLWKPMVEEMYVEETKDEEDTEDATKLSQGDGENSSKGVGLIDAVAGSNDTHKLESKSEDQETELIQNKLLTSVIAPDSFLFQDKDNVVQSGVKRLRMDAIDNTPFLSPNLNSNMDMKSYDLHVSNGLKLATENMQLSSYGIHHHQEGLVQNNSGGYGLFNSSRLSRYVDEGPVGTTYPPTASTGVSLTLGLQHSEGLSLGGSQQQPYAHAQGSLHVGRGQGGAVNYYSMHDIAAGGDSGSYETMSLQDRKRLASQLLQQDFS